MRSRSGWQLIVGLGLLSAIPLSVGFLRLLQLSGGPDVLPDDPRFEAFPVALVVHIVGSAVFVLVGALQFAPWLRRRGWHRRAGRVAVVAGLVAGGSALWLTMSYESKQGTGGLLVVFRLVFALAMAVSLFLGFVAIRRGDVAGHRAWMIRAYAIGLGAGTQVFAEGFGQAMFGTGVTAGDLEKGSAWLVNMAVAEWAIRRPTRGRRPAPVGEPA